MELPKDESICPEMLARIINLCWKHNPEDRPDFSQILVIKNY